MIALRYSAEALSDLASIRAYLLESKRSDSYVRAILERIDAACAKLVLFPRLGRSRPELWPSIRSFSIRPNVVFYEYVKALETVFIARIVDGRRDLGTLSFDFSEFE